MVCSTAATGRRWLRHRFAVEYPLTESEIVCTVSNLNKTEFFRGLKISGKIFSRRYELSRDFRKSILGVFVCKFILLVFSGGDLLLFSVFSVPVFMGSEQEAGGSLSPDLAVVLDAQRNAILTAVNAQIQGL